MTARLGTRRYRDATITRLLVDRLSDGRGSGREWPPACRSPERSPTGLATATPRTAGVVSSKKESIAVSWISGTAVSFCQGAVSVSMVTDTASCPVDWRLFVSESCALPILGAGLGGTTGEEWRDDFLALAAAARSIVVVPSTQPGSLWGPSQIAGNAWWQKTLFVMPESVQWRDEQVVAAE
jgi:hypothetical protein